MHHDRVGRTRYEEMVCPIVPWSRLMTRTVNLSVYLFDFHTRYQHQSPFSLEAVRWDSQEPQYNGRQAHMTIIVNMSPGMRILNTTFRNPAISGEKTGQSAPHSSLPCLSRHGLTVIGIFLHMWFPTATLLLLLWSPSRIRIRPRRSR
jgi:hypothetical protein